MRFQSKVDIPSNSTLGGKEIEKIFGRVDADTVAKSTWTFEHFPIIPSHNKLRWWHIDSIDAVVPTDAPTHLTQVMSSLSAKKEIFRSSESTFSNFEDTYHSLAAVKFYVDIDSTMDFSIDGDDSVSMYLDGRIISGWFGSHNSDNLHYKYHNCIASGTPRNSISESLYNSGYKLTKGWHNILILHREASGTDNANAYIRLTPNTPETPGSGSNTGWYNINSFPTFNGSILAWEEVDPFPNLSTVVVQYLISGTIFSGLNASKLDGVGKSSFMSSTVQRKYLVVSEMGLSSGTNITIPDGVSYAVGQNKLTVIRDGLVQTPGLHYIEISSTEISFQYDLPPESILDFTINANA